MKTEKTSNKFKQIENLFKKTGTQRLTKDEENELGKLLGNVPSESGNYSSAANKITPDSFGPKPPTSEELIQKIKTQIEGLQKTLNGLENSQGK